VCVCVRTCVCVRARSCKASSLPQVGIMVVVILTPSIGRETKFVVKVVVVLVLFTGGETPGTAASLLRIKRGARDSDRERER
jgi:hypothetical protein